MVDVVYPVRPGGLHEPDHLRWSLRTLWHHVDVDRVWIVGHRPSWVNWDLVGHIPSDQLVSRFANQPEPELRFLNQRANLEAVMASDVADTFLWMNDDYYALTDIASVPHYHRGSLRRYLHDLPETDQWGTYRDGLAFCLKLLESWGHPNPDNYAAHVPLTVSLPRLVEIMERAWSEGLQGGFMRSLYPVGDPARAHVEIIDPKLKTIDGLPELDQPWVSTTVASWRDGRVGHLIRNRYWRPSPYELP